MGPYSASREELVLVDLMRELHLPYNKVMTMGYYECHSLWLALDEAKARDLDHLSKALDQAQANEEYRSAFAGWLTHRQPRRYSKPDIPLEVLNKLKEAFNNG